MLFTKLLKSTQRKAIRSPLRHYSKIHLRPRSTSQRDAELLKGIGEAIQTNSIERRKLPLITRIGIFFIPTSILIAGVVGYNAYNGEETYIPLLFQKRIQVNEENTYGINLDKLKQLALTRIIQKISINNKFQQLIGLPITSQELDRFDVYLQYKNLMSSGVEINPNSKPYLSWVSRQYSINHEKLNEFLEPMGISDSDFQFQVINNPSTSIRDYKILIEGRLKVNGNELFKKTGRDCDLNFRGIIDFDHSQNIRFEEVTLCYKDPEGNQKVEKLW